MPFTYRHAVASFVVALCLAGCGGGNDNSVNNSTSQTAYGQALGLQFTATTRTIFRRGESIPVTVTVRNTTDQPVTIQYGSCAPDKSYVQAAGGTVIIAAFDHLPQGGTCGANIKSLTYAPGQSVTYNQVWDQQQFGSDTQIAGPVAAGQYRIYSGLDAGLSGDPATKPVTAPITITIQ